MAASGTLWNWQSALSARCLLCSLALVCSHKAYSAERDERPRLWMDPPAFAATPSGMLLSTPPLSLPSHLLPVAMPSLHGLIDISSSQRGGSVRGGMGLDLNLPDSGKLHLDLLPARDLARQGMRWQLDGDDGNLEGKLWSIGGCLEVIRDRNSVQGLGQRHLQLAPQLLIDADRLVGASGSSGQLILQRVHWADLRGRDTGLGPIWQLQMVWKF